ncbi:hypothetical protein [Nocardia transvalensis]|uniref:hypothetical protein n=1 Tax=Nocardia transvalensis TaxID=37333 RepID=UPI0018960C3D|nr:hypothetical protein [Nocardia transvalensis]MBF6332391.1 hypothetical protein [Nocardia transvalensis]
MHALFIHDGTATEVAAITGYQLTRNGSRADITLTTGRRVTAHQDHILLTPRILTDEEAAA